MSRPGSVSALAWGAALALTGCDPGEPEAAADGTAHESGRPPSEPPVGMTEAGWGELLFQQYGCTGCHHIHGARGVGPALDGLWGTEAELEDGSQVTVDADYVRESIRKPNAKVTKGFAPRMTSYEGVLNDAQLDALVVYIKSLK